jgi:hypothetical protein
MSTRLTIAVLTLVVALGVGCQPYYDVEVRTPIRATLDVSGFDRVLVAGFAAAGDDSVNLNEETVRLLRSQLRGRSRLQIAQADPVSIDASHLQDGAYWKRIGEEHPRALIITGSVSLARDLDMQEVKSSPLPRRTASGFERGNGLASVDRQRFTLRAVLVFIDGSTGTTVMVRPFNLQSHYDAGQDVPPLSAYFDLMDRLVPPFLRIVSDQTIRGTRTLLK